MLKKLSIFIILLTLTLANNFAFCEISKSIDAETLVKLAPIISLEAKEISSFEVKGILDINGIQLRFIISGQKPNKTAVRIFDVQDNTPIMIGIDKNLMFYDPVSSEVVIASAISTFTLKIDKESNLTMHFGFNPIKNDDSNSSYIDIRSFLEVLVRPLKVIKEKNNSFILTGITESKNGVKIYITPSRKEGAYSKMEIYKDKIPKPVIVLDEIILNQDISKERFVFPKEKLLNSTLPIKEISTDGLITKMFSMGKIMRGIMTKFVLNDINDPEMKSVLETMYMKKINWEEVKENDKKASTILKSIFTDLTLNKE